MSRQIEGKFIDSVSFMLTNIKGRLYPEMDEKSRSYLDTYFAEENKKLAELLQKHSKLLPTWLQNVTKPI